MKIQFSMCPNDRYDFRAGKDGRWRIFEDAPGRGWYLAHRGMRGLMVGPYKTKARALEQAADQERAAGASAEDCGKILAGVRW